MKIFTFEMFWSHFYYKNPGRKTDKDRCRKLWDSCNFYNRQRKAITDLERTDLTAYQYLKLKLF